mmetsp:Transcript_22715/g.69828  ORF Transcript_22715/g.69828 Transcript_22715/m.69828 type:complete len:143 (-) Transcript_22715:353-781(-)|eukprot:CAMPEP_0198656062 /NCGR_PEP_ID=MMETSP1467-20131203/8758_1 /TAXON_ID=1462469 /ORGANISM="unid. sp., Strain CCMP2135" /LENGTH=142 /DNA_ID=CAMNT_0044392077 /DNA_START=70 /DNA_END=498 /DNA_ORIENTATION=+
MCWGCIWLYIRAGRYEKDRERARNELSQQVDALEQKGEVLSLKNPGKWDAQKKMHVPKFFLVDGGRKIQVKVPHGTNLEFHKITHIWVRSPSNNNEMIACRKLRGGLDPFIQFDRPNGPNVDMVAYAACNKHDVWRSDVFTI